MTRRPSPQPTTKWRHGRARPPRFLERADLEFRYRRPQPLSGILQELVDRPGRNDGDAVVLIVTGTGERVATAFDGSAPDAPLLYVEYLP